jgi:hypothetical protein
MKSEMSEFTRKLASVIVPLKVKEERAAIQAAKARIVEELSDHHRIFGAELKIEKPAVARTTPRRAVGVLIVDYGNKRNFEVLVDGTGKVVRVMDLQGAQPAYLDEEITDARQIAERDGRVSRYAKMRRSFVSAFGPERTSDNARRIGLRYAVVERNGVSRVMAHAIVDLSTSKLVQFDETPAESDSER